MVRELSHYVDGQRVEGTSGRFSDVYDPCTGEVQARLPLASAEEVRNVIASAEKAQVAWGTMNPQRRGRILLKFVDLVNEHLDELAALLSSEHGKTLPDAKGDIQRGIEVVEFSAGAPHLLKGEFSDDAGSGIDVHSMRQPLGVVAGITPFNFPAMIPLWKSGPALAAGNDAEGLPHRVHVDAGAGVVRELTLEQMRGTRGKLDHFDAALNVTLGIEEGLAVLGGEQGGELVHVLVDQVHELEQDPAAALRIHRSPYHLTLFRAGNHIAHFRCAGQRQAGLDLAGTGIVHIAEPAGGAFHPLPANVMG